MGRSSKHVNRRYHYVRELAETGMINVKYCDTNSMLVDVFTKGLNLPKFKYCLERLGIKWGFN